jgi:hypothetical protein
MKEFCTQFIAAAFTSKHERLARFWDFLLNYLIEALPESLNDTVIDVGDR